MIRRYRHEDREAVLDVWYRASQIAHGFLSADFFERERENIVERWLPVAETIVYEDDGRLLGFLSLVGNEVGAIFVDPDHQGRGIGRALMDAARARRPALELGVFEANAIGRRFYAAYGFEFVERRINDETGRPELRMRLAAPERQLASELEALRDTWRTLVEAWAEATRRAEALPASGIHDRVDGEWSFAETLRHLIYATDAWIGRPVLEEESPFWSAALPHTECPGEALAPFAIDRRAAPDWREIVAKRERRQATVSKTLARMTPDQLDRPCRPGFAPPDLGADSDTLTVGECFRVVLEEETAHLEYARRDLDVLERRAQGSGTEI